MRNFILAFTTLAILFVMTSCGGEKCQTCTYTIGTVVTTSQQVCGVKSDLDANEEAIKAAVGSAVEVDCTRE